LPPSPSKTSSSATGRRRVGNCVVTVWQMRLEHSLTGSRLANTYSSAALGWVTLSPADVAAAKAVSSIACCRTAPSIPVCALLVQRARAARWLRRTRQLCAVQSWKACRGRRTLCACSWQSVCAPWCTQTTQSAGRTCCRRCRPTSAAR
jgi:hypothetical protein